MKVTTMNSRQSIKLYSLVQQYFHGILFDPRYWRILLLLLIYLSAMQSTLAEEKMLVVLDPGHGGTETGATAKGLREADIALDVALRTERLLLEQGFEVLLTRRQDETLSLKERSVMANSASADVFISVHVNSAESSTLHGVETYSVDIATDSYSAMVAMKENKGADMTSPPIVDTNIMLLSMELASLVQGTTIARLDDLYAIEKQNLGHKTAMFYVLVHAKMPAILYEVGFLSNDKERQQLQSAHYREQLALSLVEALGEWRDRNQ